MADYEGHYRLVESRLYRLLDGEKDILSPEEVDEVREFIDAREYGLALEALAAILDEGNKDPSLVAVGEIQQLAETMDIVHEAPIAGLLSRFAVRPGLAG